MESQQLEALIKKYNRGECTPEEKAWLEHWYLSFEWNNTENLPDTVIEELGRSAFKELKLPAKKPARQIWLYRSAAAAAVLFVFIYLLTPGKKSAEPGNKLAVKTPSQQEILPGTGKASLTLSDGTVVTLDPTGSTQLERDGATINKQQGKIVYSNAAAIDDNKVFYNTLNIPRGAEYELVLPDGSRVWLNAASSLKFPTRFSGKERIVHLAGEAYFEIAKDKTKPFRVITPNDLEVNVTGTQFNVMAYADETLVKTTLTEGRVNIKSGNTKTQLVPGQQAALQKSSGSVEVKKVDIEKEIAWKNGMIEFSDDDLPYIMRQLSRWYDVDVSFEGGVPQGGYNGSIPRKATLTEVMQILKIAGVQYRLNNRTVIITGG